MDNNTINKVWVQHYENLEKYVIYCSMGIGTNRKVRVLANAATRDEMFEKLEAERKKIGTEYIESDS